MFKYLSIVTILLMLTPSAQSALESVETYFSQDGFDGGGSISGFFKGTDLDGNGQIYAASPFISSILGLPIGNELDYAEVTFNNLDTSLGAQTIIYDKSTADIFDVSNFFFGFAYNIGSGTIGDESNEGISFSPFAPSTNYLLGEAFLGLFIESIAMEDRDNFGTCNGINFCGAVLELAPDSDSESGITTVSQNLSAAIVSVSAPTTLIYLCIFSILILFNRFSRKNCPLSN